VFTGANEVLLFNHVTPKLGDHAIVRAEGYAHPPGGQPRSRYRAVIEESVLRPVVGGADLRAWSWESNSSVIWGYDAHGRTVTLPARTTRYLERHRHRLAARDGLRAGMPLGAVFRVAPHTLSAKLAWRDLARNLEAVALPQRTRTHGRLRDLIPLNTVYYLPLDSIEDAHLLAGFNSLPCRTFARAIAERAKDAHFRFFAWVIEMLPLPADWKSGFHAERIRCIAETAHQRRGISAELQAELDRAVGRAFGLTSQDLNALREYDAWLKGE
jgi:hypothetical protein